MSGTPDYDPLRKSWREGKIIDRAWLKEAIYSTRFTRAALEVGEFIKMPVQ
jgi:hypothetical protein